MTAEILLAPVGMGKTDAVLSRLLERLQAQPFAQIWVLLATGRQETAFRERLVQYGTWHGRTFFNVHFFNFYELNRHLLDKAGRPQRHLGDETRLPALRRVISGLDDLEALGPIQDTAGLARVVGEFIYELKQRRVNPDVFRDAAATPKDRDLARIYVTYQDVLQAHDLADREGEGWLALDALDDQPDLATDVDLLLVDGFDQFTPVQADLLAAMAGRVSEQVVTLTTVPEREETVGRRFRQAREALVKSLEDLGKPYEVNYLDSVQSERHPDVRHLADAIFRYDAVQAASAGGLRMIEAPDTGAEVAAVLRQVKALLLDGVAPEEVLIALRDWERYRVPFLRYAEAYGLPLALHYGEPLLENPAVVALLSLICLADNDFRQPDLLDVLRMPYFRFEGLPSERVAVLESLSLKYGVTSGRDLWLEAAAGYDVQVQSDHDIPLADALATFFDRVTPPEDATFTEYIVWLEGLIGPDVLGDPDEEAVAEGQEAGYTHMLEQVRARDVSTALRDRDLAALEAFKRVLNGFITSRQLVHTLDGTAEDVIPWVTFYDDLLRALNMTAVDARPSRFGQVLVTTVNNARGLPHDYVFILGLSEGLFPSTVPEDPLYLDSERRTFNLGGQFLATQAERSADEGLFYELVSQTRQRLTLSRPTTKEGKPWIASSLWNATAEAFSDSGALIERDHIRIAGTVGFESAATLEEAATALAHGLSQEPVAEGAMAAQRWLRTSHPDYWHQVQHGYAVEYGRITGTGAPRYYGQLESPALVEAVQRRLSRSRRWSATQLNALAACGFHFFADRLLKLEALEEPAEEMDVLQRGTALHDVLQRTYERLRDDGLAIIAENLPRAQEILQEESDTVLADAPQRFGFRPTALWEAEKETLRFRLGQLIERDFAASVKENPLDNAFSVSGRVPYLLEVEFGQDDDQPVWLHLDDSVGAVRLKGFIDRVDRADDGLIVVDYKSNRSDSGGISVGDLRDGLNYQMLVYLYGLASLLESDDLSVLGGAFLHIMNQKSSGVFRWSIHAEDVEAGKQHLAEYLARARNGDFAVNPTRPQNGKCTRYCDFYQFCRLQVTQPRQDVERGATS